MSWHWSYLWFVLGISLLFCGVAGAYMLSQHTPTYVRYEEDGLTSAEESERQAHRDLRVGVVIVFILAFGCLFAGFYNA